MPTYLYRAEDGSEIEEVCSMLEFQRVIERDGKRYENVILGGAPALVRNYRHVAYNFHKKQDVDYWNQRGHKIPHAPGYNERGHACFETLGQIEEHEAKLDKAGLAAQRWRREKPAKTIKLK